MAKKDRVPTPPKRPVQAPKPYKAERDPRRSRLVFIVIAAAIVVAAAAIGIGFILTSGEGSAAGPTGEGDCERQTFEALEASHVEELPADYEYNSTPATSGLHNGQTAIWNLYEQPVPEINYIHNLEHGGVVVQYGSEIPPAAVSEISDWYSEDTRGLIVAPFSSDLEEEGDLADKIVATSWTHMLTCSDFDEGALDDFVDDFRGPQGDAPEKFPLDTLSQGSN